MEIEFVPYEQSLALKELGFDKPCFAYYEVSNKIVNGYRIRYLEHEDANPAKQPSNEDCLAPLYQQAFRWFREKYGLYSTIEIDQTMEPMFCYSLSKYNGNYEWDNILPTYSELYYTYEEAELACLIKLIEIVKNK